jgi:CPA2 family monovalent cation:H+ antiporter-2
LFFTAMGMLADPAWIASNAMLVGGVVAVVIFGKAAIVWAALRLFGARGQAALAAGVCLGQLGEFSFVLANIARGQILDEKTFMLVVSTTVITMALTPFLVSKAGLLAARLPRKSAPANHEVGSKTGEEGVVIVIGYGPAGRAAAGRIAKLGSHVVVVDQNPAAARDASNLGYSTVTGDARYAEVLDHAGLQRAVCVVVTVPGVETALRIVNYVRTASPETQVLVRSRFNRSLAELRAAGAHVVVDEEHEAGRRIAKAYEEMVRRSTPDGPFNEGLVEDREQ